MKKAKHSFKDTDGKAWIACCECRRGGNGDTALCCSSGAKCKKWNGLGCFNGLLLQDLEIK